MGRMTEARLDVEEAPGVVYSVRMVLLWAMQALKGQHGFGMAKGRGEWTY